MPMIEALRDCRKLRAELYAEAAARLAEAVMKDPFGILYREHVACSQAWNQLITADNALRAYVMAGDPIDDYHRPRAVFTKASADMEAGGV
jgi:hypothetical protein